MNRYRYDPVTRSHREEHEDVIDDGETGSYTDHYAVQTYEFGFDVIDNRRGHRQPIAFCTEETDAAQVVALLNLMS